jgi:hypothetical protein
MEVKVPTLVVVIKPSTDVANFAESITRITRVSTYGVIYPRSYWIIPWEILS